jgi:cytochrome c
MKITVTSLILLGLFSAPALAAGDAVAGEKAFKQCQTCHVIQAADGTLLAGKAGKTGPNLFGVIGRKAGSYPDFKYGDSMIAAGEKGLMWNEDEFTTYTKDPTAFLKEYLSDPKARGKMSFKVKKPDDAHNIWAYFMTLMPAADGTAPAPAATGG